MKSLRATLIWLLLIGNIFIIGMILTASFYIQFVWREIPCILCMVERFSMLLCACGQIYILSSLINSMYINWRTFIVGNSFTIFSAIAGGVYSARQVLLNIPPEEPGFGSPIFGLHMYSWAFLVCAAEVLAVGIGLALFNHKEFGYTAPQRVVSKIAIWFFMIVTVVFAIGTILEDYIL